MGAAILRAWLATSRREDRGQQHFRNTRETCSCSSPVTPPLGGIGSRQRPALLPSSLIFATTIFALLDQEPERVAVLLGLLDELGPKVVRPDPLGKVGDALGVERDGLAPDLVELVLPQHDLGSVHGGRKYPEPGHAPHVQRRLER